ncbi:hypothetical protein Tco_0611123 [Tanacetum coccineum]
MLPLNNLGPDESGVSVNETLFRGMIRSLMYLTASRSDIQFSTCLCARYQANPKESHNVAIKRIFRQKRVPLGLSNTWWKIKSQLADYDVLYDNVPIFCDNTSVIAISNNPVLHSRTKLIDIRYLSLIMEHLLKVAYKQADLISLKPFHTTAIIFKPSYKNETALTSHMCKVAELSPDPIKSLIPPTREVNADNTADKSLSRTFVQPVTQSKAPTAKKPKKKKISSLTKPEALQSSRIDSSST